VRARVQARVNRLLNGDRDDPYGVVVRLGQQLETVLLTEQVLPTVVQTVAEALRVPSAALSLHDRVGRELEVAAGARRTVRRTGRSAA
jgi:two-component system NarL family sensor kinase